MAKQAVPAMAFVGIGMTPYDMPLVEGDTVKVRTTPGTAPAEYAGKRGKVTSQIVMVTVTFEDGTVETFNRSELSLKERMVAMLPCAVAMDDGKPEVHGEDGEAWKG